MRRMLTVVYTVFAFIGISISIPCLAQESAKTYQNHIILLIDGSGSMIEPGANTGNLELLVQRDLKQLLFDPSFYQEKHSYLSSFRFGMPRVSPDCLNNFIVPIPGFSGDKITARDLDNLYNTLEFRQAYTGWMAALRLVLYETRHRFKGFCESTYIFLVSDMEYSEEEQKDTIEEFRYFETRSVLNIQEAKKIYYDIGKLYEFRELESRKQGKSPGGEKSYFLRIYRVGPRKSSPQFLRDIGVPLTVQLMEGEDNLLQTRLNISCEKYAPFTFNRIMYKIKDSAAAEILSEAAFSIQGLVKQIEIRLEPPAKHPREAIMEVNCEFLFSDAYYGKQVKKISESGISVILPPPGVGIGIGVLLVIIVVGLLAGISLFLLWERSKKRETESRDIRAESAAPPVSKVPICLDIGLDSKSSFPCLRFAGFNLTRRALDRLKEKLEGENDDIPGLLAKLETLKNREYPTKEEFTGALEAAIGGGRAAKYRSRILAVMNSGWFHLLPVTKLQVEQWVYEGGRSGVENPGEIIEMIRRMESPSVKDYYPETVRGIRRLPLGRIGPGDIQSVIAANLRLWSTPGDIEQDSPVTFPVLGSEWGDFVEWTNGKGRGEDEEERQKSLQSSIPLKQQAFEWRQRLSHVSSRELIREILEAIPMGRLPRSVERLLKALGEGMPSSARGLPFADYGVWELVNEPAQRKRLCRGGPGSTIYHPTVIGKTRLWPYIETEQETHVVLQPALPMVGLRLIPSNVEELNIKVEITPITFIVPKTPLLSGPAADTRKHILTPVQGLKTMAMRCPLCFQLMEKSVWNHKGNIWCALVSRKVEGEAQTEQIHTINKPSEQRDRNWRVLEEKMISNDYRDIAGSNPHLVRPLCLSGYSQHGKTCWMLSSTGNLLYPDGNNKFSRMFPTELRFSHIIAAMDSFKSDDRLNVLRSLEEMWIDGNLPLPNDIERALSSPIVFKSGEQKKQKKMVTIVNDIPGEVMSEPDFPHRAEFPHVACANEVIYLVKAEEINNCYYEFEKAMANLGTAEFARRVISKKQLNLVFALSQVDRLQLGTDIDRELYAICIQKPYILPENHCKEELMAYIRVMHKVSNDIRGHLLKRVPNLVAHAEEVFGSVRYCGFSAFGHHPLPRNWEGVPLDANGCLPIEPQPVRVVDPLLWILSDQRLLRI